MKINYKNLKKCNYCISNREKKTIDKKETNRRRKQDKI